MSGCGLIAQRIEHPPSKRAVAGSNPARSDMVSELGDIVITSQSFDQLDKVLRELKGLESLSTFERQLKVSEKLCALIQADDSTFLLQKVVHFIQSIIDSDILDPYNLIVFELWLNQYSGLSDEENFAIRAKIVGKAIPRSDYEEIFPIGMDKTYQGTHIVTAHGSPDLDTIVASFWGYVDAFGARVGDGLHIWNVPGGPPSEVVELDLLFYNMFGPQVFKNVARSRNSLSLSSYDLLTQKGLVKKKRDDTIFEFSHERLSSAVVLVDDNGRFIGDWRAVDVEGVRQVVNLFNTHLRFVEYSFQIELITLFSKSDLKQSDVQKVIDQIDSYQFKSFDPAKEMTLSQIEHLNGYMSKVLKIDGGTEASFAQFVESMESQGVTTFAPYEEALKELTLEDLFDSSGQVKEDRPLIFSRLERVVSSLSVALRQVRSYVDSLGVGFKIKQEVFGYKPTFLGYRSDLEEIKSKMQAYPYLTVNYSPSGDECHPLGVIYANDLRRSTLGTVSLRDFSNHQETHVPPYLEVISAVDHHKTALTNSTPPKVVVADVQSVNVLVAQMSFAINDKHSHGNMTLAQVDKQLKKLKGNSAQELRLQQRLMMRKINMLKAKQSAIHSEREMMEYIHFLYAIFDDTDLLTKVTRADVECVKELLNRLKSLQLGEEVEVVHFDDLETSDPQFVKKAAQKLLQNSELYSLYSKVYRVREEKITASLKNGLSKGQFPLFEDTKIQNGCARVGQKKLFAKNIAHLKKHSASILNAWVSETTEIAYENPAIDLHLLMISTIASAEDLYKAQAQDYPHQDELWVYISGTETSIQHLKLFLSAFSKSPHLVTEDLSVEFLGKNGKELAQIFTESFIPCTHTYNDYDIPVAIIHYKAGSINSRKSMISPYLPKLPL